MTGQGKSSRQGQGSSFCLYPVPAPAYLPTWLPLPAASLSWKKSFSSLTGVSSAFVGSGECLSPSCSCDVARPLEPRRMEVADSSRAAADSCPTAISLESMTISSNPMDANGTPADMHGDVGDLWRGHGTCLCPTGVLDLFSSSQRLEFNDQPQSVSGTPPVNYRLECPGNCRTTTACGSLPGTASRLLVAELSTPRWASDWPTSVGSWNLGTPIQVPHGNPQKLAAEHVN